MSRKGINKIREVLPDTIYSNVTVSKIINACMRDGKRTASEKQVYDALDLIKKEFPKEEVLEVLDRALENIRPKIEVRPRRIGGAVYQVPTPVRGNRQNSLALRWLIKAARAKANKQYHSFAQKLVAELLSALNNEGAAVNKRVEVEKMADANKAFAHLRW
ncbi:MAG: 30S ribosomal protein S7 [Candidatus Shapirobacteria bacterium]|nr:30S ribosomal protein S7 [Candidatus Shapirobacteria bacterium]MDD4383069.1 30S ribosomal protein S7 [Candidatus Shapirobacteria bacterium]